MFYIRIEKFAPVQSQKNWISESEVNCKNGVFVNLLKNAEAFTGYMGKHIWKAIYEENCFSNK